MSDPIPPSHDLRNRWFTWTPTRFGRLNFQREEHLAALTERILDDRPPAVVVLSGEPGIGRGFLCEAAADRARDAGRKVAVWHLDFDGFEPENPQPLVGYLEHLLEAEERKGRAPRKQVRDLLVDFGVEFGAALTDPISGLAAVAMSLWLQFHDRPPVAKLAKQWSRPQGRGAPPRKPVEALQRFVAAVAEEAFLLIHVVDSVQVPFDVRRWLIREAKPGRVLVALGCAPFEATNDVAPALASPPLRLDLEPLTVQDLQTVLDQRFAPHALPAELTTALIRYSGGWPALVANAVADLMEVESLRRDEQDVWRLPEGVTSPAFVRVVSIALFDDVDAELARIDDAGLRRRVTRFLILAALCGRYVPLALPLACMKLTKDQADDLTDWLDETLVEQLGWMHDLGWGHRAFPGFNVYGFAHPVLPHAILDRLAASEYERAGEAVTLLRYLEHQKVPVEKRAMARMFLSIAEHLDPRAREPYLRKLEWWISLDGLDALREELREALQDGRLDPELLWRVIEATESWQPQKRLALLDTYGEAVLTEGNNALVQVHLPTSRWYRFHSLRALLLIRGPGSFSAGLEEALESLRFAESNAAYRCDSLWLCGIARTAQGAYREARNDLQKALELSLAVHGRESDSTLRVQNSLAVTLRHLGELDTARVTQETVLETSQKLHGPKHLDTLTAQANLAGILKAQGDLSGARDLQEAVRETSQQLLGLEHPVALNARANLADSLRLQGELPAARELQEQVLETLCRIWGPEHPVTVTARANLAGTLLAQGDFQHAREFAERVLASRRRVLGPEHPDTLEAQADLAVVLRVQGELQDSQQLEEQVLEARWRLLGPEHPHTLTARASLATTLRAQGEISDAQHLADRTLEACQRVLGPKHPDTRRLSKLLNELSNTPQENTEEE
ncbi:MAG: tetratricopeptide repeat protein [Acidobacteriota bacterium]